MNAIMVDGVLLDSETGAPIQISKMSSGEEITITEQDELAYGVAVNPYQKSSVEFIDELTDYKGNFSIGKQIKVSNKIFRYEDIVSTTIEILIDFTINRFFVEGIPEESEKVIKYWMDSLNKKDGEFSITGLRNLAEVMAYEWFISGNVIPYERWEVSTIDGNKYKLPVSIKLLNPRAIRIDVNSFVVDQPRYQYNPGFVNELDSTETKFFANDLQFKTDRAIIDLDPDRFAHLKRRARDYDVWGIPYLTKIFQAVAYKHKLIKLDTQTIEGLVNMLTVFKIGSPDVKSPYHKVTNQRLKAFSSLIKNPQASSMLVWAHDIDILTTGPDGKIMEFADKYKEADLNIIRGMGVPPILIDGTGSAQAAWVTVIALVERLEKVRIQFSNYFTYIISKILKMNNMEGADKVKIKWSPTNLRNEKDIKTLLLSFYDRGLLPIQTMHDEGGYNHDEMVRLKEIEQEMKLTEKFVRPSLPYERRNPDEGRPVDNINTTKPEVETTASANIIDDMISSKYMDDVKIILDDLENEIVGMDGRRTNNKLDLLFTAKFTRLMQISAIYATFENAGIDSILDAKLSMWHSKHLDNLKKYISKNVKKISAKKIDMEEKIIYIRGIFAEAKKRSELFVKESLRNIELAKTLDRAKKDGYTGAIVRTNPNTKCEYCAKLDGKYFKIDAVFDTFPAHPHQHFELEFVMDDNTINSGNTEVLVQNPKRLNKTL